MNRISPTTVKALYCDATNGGLCRIIAVDPKTLTPTGNTATVAGWGAFDGPDRPVYRGPAKGDYHLTVEGARKRDRAASVNPIDPTDSLVVACGASYQDACHVGELSGASYSAALDARPWRYQMLAEIAAQIRDHDNRQLGLELRATLERYREQEVTP